MKKLYFFAKDFALECQKKNLVLLAASSSFFFFLGLIPVILLMLSFAGFMFESVTPKDSFSFLQYIDSVIPEDIIPTFRKVFRHSNEMIAANTEHNFLHYIVLAFSSLGFFGSIWKSVDIIIGERRDGKILRTLKSFLTIAFSFAFILLLAAIPLFIKFLNIILKNDFIKRYKAHEFLIQNFKQFEVSGINLLSAFVLFVFFIFFFKFLLRGNATRKATIVGSAFFTFSVVGTKFLFFSYLILIKENLINNYGQLYSLLLFALWIYAVILVFYMAIIFTYVLSRQHFGILKADQQ